MTTVYDVPPDKLVKKVGGKLKKNKAIALPKWAVDVKKGANTDLPPQDEDWWWVRCASVLRQIYLHGPVGVARLRTYYGGRVNRGAKKERFREASGKIIREVLSQLERAGYVAKTKRGRKISPEGQKFLDNTAHELKLTHAELKEE
ncbi:30S ribosomal protein S19e [ANME-1 cluster archaeon GoMg4]|nr:30S ribosomal protein S19e [ANME-1 cluster archaeon GoMg4]